MITETHLGELNDIIRRSKEHTRHLSEFEKIYLEDWESRFATSGVRVIISDKQAWIFENIHRKLAQLEFWEGDQWTRKQFKALSTRDNVKDCYRDSGEIDLCKTFCWSCAC